MGRVCIKQLKNNDQRKGGVVFVACSVFDNGAKKLEGIPACRCKQEGSVGLLVEQLPL